MSVHRCPECGNRLTTNYCDICMRKVPFAGAKPGKYRDPWDYSSAHRQEEGHKCVTFDHSTETTQSKKQTFSRSKQTFTGSHRGSRSGSAGKTGTAVVVIVAIIVVWMMTFVYELIDTEIAPEPEYAYEELTPESSADVPAVEPRTLYEGNGIRITLDGSGREYDEFVLYLTVENGTQQDIIVNSRLLSVNSYMFTGALFEQFGAGQTVQTCLPIYEYELRNAGIEQIAEIAFQLELLDGESYTAIDTTELITVYTDRAENYEITVDASGMELYNDGSLWIMAKTMEFSPYGDGKVKLYMENQSGSTVAISTQQIRLNGQEVSGGVWSELRPDTRAITEIYFYEFEQLDITQMDQIKEISLDLHIEYMEDWYVAETINKTVTFTPSDLMY